MIALLTFRCWSASSPSCIRFEHVQMIALGTKHRRVRLDWISRMLLARQSCPKDAAKNRYADVQGNSKTAASGILI